MLKWKDGHLAWASGHIVTDCDCCGGTSTDCCDNCPDGTPQTLTVTLTGTSLVSGCNACFDGMDSFSSDGSSFDGTYTLTKGSFPNDFFQSCCWTGTVTKTVDVWSGSNDCGATPSGGGPIVHNTITSFTIALCLAVPNAGDDPVWFFQIEGGSAGYVTQLFVADNVSQGSTCYKTDDLPTFTNGCNGVCGMGTYYAGNGGTAVVTFEHGDSFVTGCAPSCDTTATYTVVVSLTPPANPPTCNDPSGTYHLTFDADEPLGEAGYNNGAAADPKVILSCHSDGADKYYQIQVSIFDPNPDDPSGSTDMEHDFFLRWDRIGGGSPVGTWISGGTLSPNVTGPFMGGSGGGGFGWDCDYTNVTVIVSSPSTHD